MCSLGDDADASSTFKQNDEVPVGTTCIKCRENPSIIILRSKDAYCRECFLKATVHKFKSLLGKHKLIKPNDKVLIIYDGGESSTAMLHFIRTGLNLANPKRLKFEPIVVFIEPENVKLSSEKFDELIKAVEKRGFLLYLTPHSDYLKNSCVGIFKDYKEYLERPRNKTTSVEDRYSLSDRNLMTKHNKREHYIDLARELECKFCFTSELIMDIASTIISNLAFGRGNLLPMDVGVYDDRDDHVKIMRPMRLLDIKEIQFYNSIYGLKSVQTDLRECQANVYDSIQNLVQHFVGNLQCNYPATVNTIVRTADKLGTTQNSQGNKCALCKCPIENNLATLSSNESTEFSSIVSTNANISIDKDILEVDNNQNEFCYSCRKLSRRIKLTK